MPQGGILNSKLFKIAQGVGTGFAAGGPAGAVVGGVGALNPNVGAGMNLYKMGNDASSAMGGAAPGGDGTPYTDANFKMPEMGGDALSRRMSSSSPDPMASIDHGLKLLNDPSLDMPYEHRMAGIESLLRAKHGVGDPEGFSYG